MYKCIDIDIESFKQKPNREIEINNIIHNIRNFAVNGTQIDLNGFAISKKMEENNIDVSTVIDDLTCVLKEKIDEESNIFTDLDRMIEVCEDLLNDCNPNSYNSIENLLDVLEEIKSELEDFEGISDESINYNRFIFNRLYLNLKKRFEQIGYKNIKEQITMEEQRAIALKQYIKDKR